MSRPNHVKERFAQVLKSALATHFDGRLPSNAVIAREFNLRAYGTDPVTQESVRRWVQGISMPDETKMRVIVSWLDLDLKAAFGPQAPSSDHHPPRTPNGHSGHVRTTQLHAQHRLAKHQAQLLKLLDELTPTDKKLVIDLTKKLARRPDR